MGEVAVGHGQFVARRHLLQHTQSLSPDFPCLGQGAFISEEQGQQAGGLTEAQPVTGTTVVRDGLTLSVYRGRKVAR